MGGDSFGAYWRLDAIAHCCCDLIAASYRPYGNTCPCHDERFCVQIWLPPSEGKHAPTTGPALDLKTLYLPELGEVRSRVMRDLQEVSSSKDALKILKVGPKAAFEIEANTRLAEGPCAPAIDLYTGVLYEALQPSELPEEALKKIRIFSGLFGVVRATDPIPNHRLSIGVTLPALGPLTAMWRKHLQQVLEVPDEGVFDARSGPYRQAFPLPKTASVIELKAVKLNAFGKLQVVSHFAKYWRGVAARELLRNPAQDPYAILAGLSRRPDVKDVIIDGLRVTVVVA
ncbi:peroxide stress protein YaaA [Actinomycetaceae bacterium WB03_NA08]|uniref:Peroxide stress protein YaaA n=1 Tax=Scrofimicrobium canadense TaxID=2652290 RepID=A0A6N7W707_9ACTO|nr:peroxide stress protein YaaA [Scrofimicrobium canadense]